MSKEELESEKTAVSTVEMDSLVSVPVLDIEPELYDKIVSTKEPTKKEWRGFWTVLLVQAQNAMNEKAAQFLLIPLGAALWKAEGNLEYYLGAIIVLPYLLISPFVGWVADRYCKARIIQAMAFLQIFVMLGMWYSLIHQNIYGAIVWFTVFAVQATLLSPAKKGIIKDIVGVKRLGFASGLVEMTGVFALMVGQVGVFVWFDLLNSGGNDPWHSAAFPTLILTLCALPPSLASLFLPRYPVLEKKPFRWSIFYEHIAQVKELWKKRELRLSEIGISYFWFFAGVMLLMTLQIAKDLTGGGDGFGNIGAVLMGSLCGGVIVGGIVISCLSRRKIELGIIPLGALGMTVSTLLLACFPLGSYAFDVALFFSGFSGAFFLVPLNGYLQNNCDNAKRGNIIAAGNFLDMSMGFVAVIFQMSLKNMEVSIAWQCLILCFLTAGITFISLRLIPGELIKLVGLWLVQLFFRPRILNGDRLPEEGGVLLVSNHVTLADALFLTLVSTRPIRFIVAKEYTGVRLLGWILELFDSVPISNSNPKEALRVASEALRQGQVICIFPEGQLTRTGVMTKLQRGFEIMAHRANVPILPIYMDGLWGGFLSYTGRLSFVKMPKRIPHRFTVVYGKPVKLSPEDHPTCRVRHDFEKLASCALDAVSETGRSALRHILERMGNQPLVFWEGGQWTAFEILTAFLESRTPKGDSPGHPWMRLFVSALSDREMMTRFWINAQQINRVNALQPGKLLLLSVGKNESYETVVSVFWALLTKTPLYLLTEELHLPESVRQIAGSHYMRERLASILPANHHIPFFDFSGEDPLSLPNIPSRPCYVTEKGIILSLSMTREVFRVDDKLVQLGLKVNCAGLLLPGFIMELAREDERVRISGPSLSSSALLPQGWSLDGDNFVVKSWDKGGC